MSFCEKLRFLMDVTKTSNSALAHAVKLDASYISRLRAGKRRCPQEGNYIHAMAAFFARRCDEEYQRRAFCDALGLQTLPQEEALLTVRLTAWLAAEKADESAAVGQFLGGLCGLHAAPAAQAPSIAAPIADHHRPLVSIYYGVEGKRRAVREFLTEVAERESPGMLLLYSDEETGWMTEDLPFAREWAALMFRVLSRGNRIRIVHTIQRDLDEMLRAISQWMPLYMAGNIEPYFYPKKRDGIFKQTMFIAPETAAVIASSVGESIRGAANMLFREKTAVAAYADEFMQYLRLCRPLMRIFSVREIDDCRDTLLEFEQEQTDALVYTESLSLLTMPEDLLGRMLARAGLCEETLVSYQATRRKQFFAMLGTCRFTELIRLPDKETLCEGGVKVALSEMMRTGTLYYTKDEYLEHLAAVVELLCRFPRYRAHIVSGGHSGYVVYVRDGIGVFVSKTSAPPVVLAMNEGNMVAAFWDYLQGMVGDKAYYAADNTPGIQQLQGFLSKMGQ